MLFIPVGVGSNSGNSFEIAELLKKDLQEVHVNNARPNENEKQATESASQGYTNSILSSNESPEKDITSAQPISSQVYTEETTMDGDRNDRPEYKVELFDLDRLDVQDLKHVPVIVFVCSTTGDGDAPYNMQRFWKELRRKSWNGSFSFYFAVVCLGDSSYPKYNYAGKRLFNRLQQVGGIPLCERCDCDDADPMGVYSAYIPWVVSLKQALGSIYSEVKGSGRHAFSREVQAPYTGIYLGQKKLAPAACPDIARILGVDGAGLEEEISDLGALGSMYSSVYEYQFSIDNGHEYSVGDVLAIKPENACYKDSSAKIFLDDAEFDSRHIDYHSIPMYHHIQQLYDIVLKGAHADIFCPDNLKSMYLDKLKDIGASYDLYYSYVLKPKKSFKDVLTDFYIKVSVKACLIRRILPRYYTISKRDGATYSITAGRIRIKHYTKEIYGVCSEYLAHLEKGALVSIDIKKSQLSVQGDLFIICTGTGISLGRTILNEYLAGRLSDVNSISILFGFRSMLLDCFHYDELLQNKTIEIIQKNGHVYITSKVTQKKIQVLLAPSRIKEASKVLEVHGISRDLVRPKNYIENVLQILSKEELNKNIILCGGVRLIKTIPKILEEISGTVTKPQSECW
ncbi:hypothetical protein NEAUS06_0536 [Nematocida ausubeli]|nr:hypothetical protein NEAUS06_0536 [Nematocida ausubeli]